MRKVLIILLLIALLVLFRVVNAQTSQSFVVDHTNLYLFDQIPDSYITQASQMTMLFADRSVGSNISDGLTCLSYSSTSLAPNHCKRPSLALSELVADTKYNRSNWQFYSTETHSSYFSASLPPTTVIGYMPNYLEFSGSSFDAVFDNVITQINNKGSNKIFYTSSLARTIGTQSSYSYNNALRNWIGANGGVMVDVADIESHAINGSECLVNGYPAICPDYTSEVAGGHLGSMSTGKIRIAKAIWIAMAYKAGWHPNGGEPTATPLPTPLPTTTPIPTLLWENVCAKAPVVELVDGNYSVRCYE